ncbi:AraC family transcriptional regulator [Marmoricola endophyticus]|uniref:AraC family transcriptional regulator n=1 Tax=Marmoricola endophyticus TaxID=2040280 RepID=A0A917BHH6_9ACTN|nr:AraC family transcriptional regulator [Marmoricola endophyticus]GGF39340.1 AraC family transcriptional regulator [Marmoricola endophyticus]
MIEALAGSPVVHTHSLEEAREAVTRVYLPHRLDGRRDEIDMRLNAVSDPVLTLGYLTYGGETALHMPATESCYHVNLDVAGQTWADRSDGAVAHTRPHQGGTVLTPTEDTTVRWSGDAEQLILKVSRARMESHLCDLLGRPVSEPVRFDLALDLTGEEGQALLRSVAFLAAELDRPGALEATLARTQLESYVLTRLLMAGHHQFSDALRGHDDSTRLGRLAPVVAYVDEHADTELTPAVLARVACVSVRTLHAAFQERLGESPMSYVRRVRLEKVRAELLEGDPATTRVTEVATRWGFFHQSRFAQQYRRHTGELPSRTLLR